MHVRRIAYLFDDPDGATLHPNVSVAEDWRCQFPFGPDDRHGVGLLDRIEVPEPGPDESALESKCRRSDVLSPVRACRVRRVSRHGNNAPEKEIEQIEAMRPEIEEEPCSAGRRVDT